MLDKTFASVGPGARVPSSQLLILAAENCSVRFANSLMVMPIFFRLTVILSPMRCWYEALKDLTSDDLNYGFKKMLVTIIVNEDFRILTYLKSMKLSEKRKIIIISADRIGHIHWCWWQKNG